MLAEGAVVRVSGLKGRPDLNGETGRVLGALVAATGRYPVRVKGEDVLLRAANLTRIDADDHGDDALGMSCDSSSAKADELKSEAVDVSSDHHIDRVAGVDWLPIPDAPMWQPPVGGATAMNWKPGGAVEIHGKEDEDEDGFEDEEGDVEEDEESRALADAALLEAAVLGAKQAPPGTARSFAPTAPSEWCHADSDERGADESEGETKRYMADVCGGLVQECDVRTDKGLERARDAIRRRIPVVMRGGAQALLGEAAQQMQSVAALDKHLAGGKVSVLFAPPETARRFTYYFDENAYDWNLMAPPPVNKRLAIEWTPELVATIRDAESRAAQGLQPHGTFYLQLALATRMGGPKDAIGANGATPLAMRSSGCDELLAQLQEAIRSPPMSKLAAQLGPWQSSMLYVGPAGTLAPCHWDALDNIFTQLAGVKQVLLFAPDAAGMRPFPYNHPYDSRSQLDLEKLSPEELAPLRGQGLLARLSAGDTLFIPNQWWHHIHAAHGGDDGLSLSVNCWFNPFEELAVTALPFPLKPHVHAQVARAVEALLTGAVPHVGRVPRAFQALQDVLSGRDPGQTDAPHSRPQNENKIGAGAREKEVAMRNYVAKALAVMYGREGAVSFCGTYLDPRRWTELKGVCFKASTTT